MKKDNNKKSGFTLVEALVAMVILMLAIGGSLATFGLSMRSILSSNDHIQAVHSLRAVHEDMLSTLTLSKTSPPNNTTYTETRDGYSVSYYFTNNGNNTRKVHMSVRYINPMGKLVTQRMETILSETLH